jgi:glucokinase
VAEAAVVVNADFDETPAKAVLPTARRAGPGISTSGPLSRLTSHSR